MRCIGWAVIAAAGSVSAQDTIVTLEPSGPGRYSVVAEFVGGLPAVATRLGSVWETTSFEITGDGAHIVSIDNINPAYSSCVSCGGPQFVAGTTASFAGQNPPAPLGVPDGGNPFRAMDILYAGNPGDLALEFTGLNTAHFFAPDQPFGLVVEYSVGAADPGGLSIEFAPIPAPGSVAVLGVGAVLMRPRR